jgi:tRNA(Ile)-lysidine synthase
VPIAEEPVGDEEADALLRGLSSLPSLVIAASGGPDSTALLVVVARWVKRLRRPPKLFAVTVDHGLRPQSALEAVMVKRLSRQLGVPHRTVRWSGKKPKSGLQEAARAARYRLLAEAAARAGCAHVLTAHTLDDQAETVLFRLARGSGLTGLAGMAGAAPWPIEGSGEIFLLRPFLHLPKARLLATLRDAGIAYSEDPSNSDPRFTRARLRALMPALAREGLDARGLSRLAKRMRRAEVAIEFAVGAARAALAPANWPRQGPIVFERDRFLDLPAEVGLRLLGRAIAHVGGEGPAELGQIEGLYDALLQSPLLRRTLAGALISLAGDRLTVERAPARRASGARRTPYASQRSHTPSRQEAL